MPTAFSILAGREVDTSSEEWRHECECRWLLNERPSRREKHLYLYGVSDRSQLFSPGSGKLRDDYQKLWERKPLMHYRSLDAADRILSDAKKLWVSGM